MMMSRPPRHGSSSSLAAIIAGKFDLATGQPVQEWSYGFQTLDYPESTFVFTERMGAIGKIGDSLPVTDEQLEDVAMMSGYVNSRLTFGVRQRFDRQTLIGNGTTPNLRGIANVAGIQTQARGVDPVPDSFFKAMTNIRVTGRAIPTHHVIHPTDWQGVRLLRTADGVYVWGSPSKLASIVCGAFRWCSRMLARPAPATGSFQPSWISLFERRGVDVQVGYVGTQFTEGSAPCAPTCA
jgi:hypothetical protein